MDRMDAHRLHKAMAAAQAQRRRLALILWQERYETLLRTRTRTDTERLAKHQALSMMEQARPGPAEQGIAAHG